jgi:hypothetical protein
MIKLQSDDPEEIKTVGEYLRVNTNSVGHRGFAGNHRTRKLLEKQISFRGGDLVASRMGSTESDCSSPFISPRGF